MERKSRFGLAWLAMLVCLTLLASLPMAFAEGNSDVEAAQKAVDAANAAVQTAQQQLDAATQKETEAASALDAAAKAVQEAQAAKDDADAKAAEPVKKAEEAAKALEEAKKTLESAQSALKDAESAASSAQSAVSDAEKAKSDAESDLEKAEKAVKDAEKAKSDAEAAADKAEDELDDAKAALKDAESEKDDAKVALDDAKDKLDAAKEKYEKVKDDEEASDEDKQEAKEKYEAAKEAKEKAESKYDKANGAVSDAESAVSKKEKALESAKDAVMDAEEALSDAKDAASDAASAVSKAEKAIEDAEEAAKSAKADADAAQTAVDAAKSDADAKESEAKSAADAAKSYQDAADAAAAKLAEAKAAQESAQSAKDAATQEVQTATQALQKANEDLEAAKKALAEAQAAAGATVTVTFDTDGGSAVAAVTGKAGEAVTKPADPTKEGFTFAGWDPALPETFPEADLTVKAQWTANVVTIVKIELDDIEMTYKPSLEDALKLMPAKAQVGLSDGTETEATLVWNDEACPGYAEKEGDGEYAFVAASVETAAKNPLAEGVTATCTLIVGPAVEDGFIYRANAQGEATVIGYEGSATELIVPAELGGNKVVTIGKEAFKGLKKVTSIELPAGLRAIEDSAFAECAKLASLTLPDSLTTNMPDNAVEGDTALRRVTLETSLKTTLHAANSFENTSPVMLPVAITDLHVLASTLTLESVHTLQNGDSIIVESGTTLTVAEKGSLLNFGTVSNYGTVNVSGTVYTCGGTWAQKAATVKKGGTLVTEHSYQPDSKYEYDVCRYCGHKEKITKTELTVKYTGATLSKTYDKTRNVVNDQGTWLLSKKPTRSDFSISGYVGDFKSVKISKISVAKFDKADAGNYNLKVTFTLDGDDAARYEAKSATIKAVIDKRPVVVTPTAGLSKVYGTADPAKLGLSCSPKGLLGLTAAETAAGAKLYTGKMTRQTGEDVGRYKFLIGTLDFGNKNYDVTMADEYFTITAKSINQSDVGLVSIGNQKYTGKAITPEITLRYGTKTLKQGTDFKAEFKNNVEPGTATVKLTGIGNYTGERQTTFNILKVTSETGGGSTGTGTGSGSGTGTYTHTGFDTGDTETETAGDDDFFGEEDEATKESKDPADVGNLVLGEVDYGTILFGARGDAMPFALFEDEDETIEGQRTLTIIPDPMVDATTGEGVMLEDGERERYPELHLRLGTALAQELMQNGVTEIIYELEQADLHIPLTSLVSEIPLPPAPAVEDAVEFEDDVTGEPIDDATEEEPAPEMLQVDCYDISLEQADATGLTERESSIIENRELMAPAYRLRVRVVPVGAEVVPTGLADPSGAPVMQAVSQELPEGFYLANTTLVLQPGLELETAPEGAETLCLAIEDAPQLDEVEAEPEAGAAEAEPLDETELMPTVFVEQDGLMVAQIPVSGDALYAVSAPEGWDPTEYMAQEPGDFEDLDDGEDFGDADDSADYEDDGEFEEI